MCLKKLDFGEPAAFLCSSEIEISFIVKNSGETKEGGFILLLRHDEKLLPRLIPAYINAKVRFTEGEARAKTLPMEMLLFVAGTMRTDKAIRESGASDNRRFVLFTDDRKGMEKFAKKNEIRVIKEYKIGFSEEIAGSVASVGFMEGN